MLITFTVILAILLFIIFQIIRIYNSLIRAQNNVQNNLADIAVVLNKRYDLIPNLVATAKKYMEHENDTFIRVTEARNSAQTMLKSMMNDKAAISAVLPQLLSAEQGFSSALGGFNLQIENYPELKADTQMLNLQQELSNLENELAAIRASYNFAVTDFNNLRQVFPNNLISGFFNFKAIKWLEIDNLEEKKEAVKVEF